MQNKSYIRNKKLNVRDNISIKKRKKKSDRIFRKFIELEEYKNSKVIGIYLSFKSEVITLEYINYFLNDDKIIVVPKIISDINMEFVQINCNFQKEIKKNKWGIYEPNSNVFFNKNDIDIIVVPIVSFDKNNNRIGYGNGFYDFYLSNFKGKTIGFAFKKQKTLKKIPINSYDIKLNHILFS